MLVRFWSITLFFHLALGICAILIGPRWARARAWYKATWRWLDALARDGARFGIALCVLALVAGVMVPPQLSIPFAAMRFLCQGLFGEGVALAVFVAAL